MPSFSARRRCNHSRSGADRAGSRGTGCSCDSPVSCASAEVGTADATRSRTKAARRRSSMAEDHAEERAAVHAPAGTTRAQRRFQRCRNSARRVRLSGTLPPSARRSSPSPDVAGSNSTTASSATSADRHPHEPRRGQRRGQRRQRLAQQERPIGGVQVHVVAARLDPTDLAGMHEAQAPGVLDDEAIAPAFAGHLQQRVDRRRRTAAASQPRARALQRRRRANRRTASQVVERMHLNAAMRTARRR